MSVDVIVREECLVILPSASKGDDRGKIRDFYLLHSEKYINSNKLMEVAEVFRCKPCGGFQAVSYAAFIGCTRLMRIMSPINAIIPLIFNDIAKNKLTWINKGLLYKYFKAFDAVTY